MVSMGRVGFWIPRIASFLLLSFLAWSCVAPPPVEEGPPLGHPGPRAVRAALAGTHRVLPLAWPSPGARAWPALADLDLAVLDLRSRAFPPRALDQGVCRALAKWVREGGSLLLLGYAPRWIEALGFEKRGPDSVYLFRHGQTDQALRGTYFFGLQAIRTRENLSLLQGLQAWKPGGNAYLLGGGSIVDLEIAGWRKRKSALGLPLGRLFRIKEGTAKVLPLEVFHLWRPGRGRILALGLGLRPDRDGSLPSNAAALLLKMTAFLTGKEKGARLGWLRGRDPAPETDDWVLPPPPPKPGPPWWKQSLPLLPSLAHWGVRTRTLGWSPRKKPRTPREVLGRDVEGLCAAGADYLELDTWGPGKGYPFAWPQGDPLLPPPGWLGRPRPGGWSLLDFRNFARAAHGAGFLVAPYFQEAPVAGWNRPGGPAALRRAAALIFRECFDWGLQGPGPCMDGIVPAWWPADPSGSLQGLLWRYHPGAFMVQPAVPHRITPSATRALNAQFGRIRGIEAGGLARGWRWDDFPPLYQAAEADIRLLPCSGADPGRILAGRGAWPDWVAAQVQDFARSRSSSEAALAFLGWEEGRAPAFLRNFARGLMTAPSRAALCFRLAATGKGGWRDQARRWVPGVQAGFGALDERPCSTACLQNGFLRLYGTGGSLLYDPAGLSDFPRAGDEVDPRRVLSVSFFRTLVRGVAASPSEVAPWRVVRDAGTRSFTGPGKWKARAWVNLDPSLPAVVPQRMVPGAAPEWPEMLRILAGPPPGLYRFRLEGVALGGGGMLRLETGGEPLAFRSFAVRGEKVVLQADLPKTAEGNMEVDLVLESGAGLVLKRISLERVGDVAVASRVVLPSGPRAVLEERLWSSHLVEKRRVVMAQDTPGLVVEIEVERADRGCRVDREILLTGYDELLRGGKITREGAVHGPVEGPWVLRDSRGLLPDLLVVHLEKSAHQKLAWRPGFGLVLEDFPQASERSSLGFFLPRGEIPREKRFQIRGALLEILDPPKIKIGPARLGRVKHPFPFPWARVLEVLDPPPAPLLVRENGWWVSRPLAPLAGKGGAALVLHQRPGETSLLRAGKRRTYIGPAGRRPGGVVLPVLPGGWRPGRGAAGLLALRILEKGKALEAAVLRTGPFLFAPSVETGAPVGSVLLDGKPWSFFEGKRVFLPRKKGIYKIRVFPGEPDGPHLSAASALVEECAWDPAARVLRVRLAHPGWFRGPLPPKAPYTLLVRPRGRTLLSVEGARLLSQESLARPSTDLPAAREAEMLFAAGPGWVKIHFQ